MVRYPLTCTLLCGLAVGVLALPTPSVVNEIASFSVPRSPSGLFFDEDASQLLYVLCGTQTNGDHYLYVMTLDGAEQCLITIPQSVGMSRVDGFYITHDDAKAYIVDSQGPIWAEDGEDRLGGSVYQVDWSDPCGCNSGICMNSSVEWFPAVTEQWSLNAIDVSASEGGGVDEYFRNSGVVVVDDHFFGVNGVHPINGDLTGSYPKSIIKVDISTGGVVETWPFDGATRISRDVDMEGLTCGPDQCTSSLFIGDEYTYIYQMDLESGNITNEWDVRAIANVFVADRGIEALTFASSTGYFYAGIQDTAEIHVLELTYEVAEVVEDEEEDAPVNCTNTTVFPVCSAPPIPASEKRIRRELRSLSTEEWDNVVAALWKMKNLTDMESGKEIYGENYRSYDYFILKHAVAVTDTRGDQGHGAAHFMVWHMAFLQEFELALLAVDPSIGALPYWDECLTEPSLFSDDYFGADPEGEPFEVVTGRFAYWPISNFSWDDWSEYIADDKFLGYAGSGDPSSTFLRGSDNLVNNTYMTRYGSGSAWESAVGDVCPNAFWDCASSTENWIDWYSCIESGNQNYPGSPSFHAPHPVVGGRIGGGRPPGGGGGGGPPPNDGGGGGPPVRFLQGGGGRGPSLRGDLEDPQTSPNSPLFMFFHANLDRDRLWWMQRHNTEQDKCNYYGFPVENAPSVGGRDGINPGGSNFYGAHLNDVSSSTMGFTPRQLGFVDFFPVMDANATTDESSYMLDEDYQVTNADLLCWMNPSAASYTYDTNLNCLVDSALCEAEQALGPLVVFVEQDRPERPPPQQPQGEVDEGLSVSANFTFLSEGDGGAGAAEDVSNNSTLFEEPIAVVERTNGESDSSESPLLESGGGGMAHPRWWVSVFFAVPIFLVG